MRLSLRARRRTKSATCASSIFSDATRRAVREERIRETISFMDLIYSTYLKKQVLICPIFHSNFAVQTNKKEPRKNPAFAGPRLGLKGFNDILGSGEPDIRPVMRGKSMGEFTSEISHGFLVMIESPANHSDCGNFHIRVPVDDAGSVDDRVNPPSKVRIYGLHRGGEKEVSVPLAESGGFDEGGDDQVFVHARQ